MDVRPTYNLYLLDRKRLPARVKLDRPSQARLGELLEAQLAALLDPERERHPYAPGFRPSDGGIVRLELALPEPLARLAPTAPNDVPVWSAKPDGEGGSALLAVDGARGRFLFQALEARRLLSASRPAILFDGRTASLSEVSGLLVGPKLDAAHVEGALHFTSEAVVRRFLDLDGVFRAATDLEVRELFALPAFTGFDPAILAPSICDTWTRRRVMSIRLSGVCTGDVAALAEAARRCQYALAVDRGCIVVPREKKPLKDLLKFLSEDYLDSPLRPGHVFEVASKRPRAATP
jgi:hypothetical protein